MGAAAAEGDDVVHVGGGHGPALSFADHAERVAAEMGEPDLAPRVAVAPACGRGPRRVDLRTQRTFVLRTAGPAPDEGMATGMGTAVGRSMRHDPTVRRRGESLHPTETQGTWA